MIGTQGNLTRYVIAGMVASGVYVAAALSERPERKDSANGNAADDTKSVTLAYMADIHGQLEEHTELFWTPEGDEVTTAGGAARIAAAVKQLRNEKPGQVLFMDGGDTIQGHAATAWTEGAVMPPVMNELGLDLAIPGNWEVVYGPDVMVQRAKEFNYPSVAANIFREDTGELVFEPYAVKNVNGVKVAVIGFTDPDVPQRQAPSYSKGLIYKDYKVLPPIIEKVRTEEQADIVIVLTHIGLGKAVRLAERLQGVDVVLSSDTHERTYEPIVRGDTWVVEPGSFGSFLGQLELTVSDGEVVHKHWELVELRADKFPEDPQVKKTVETVLAPHRDKLNEPIGHLEVPLLRYNVVETNLDALLSDALRDATGTDIALSNGFRFAHPVDAGVMTEEDLWNVFPVVTKVKTGKATGKQLREFWEREIEHVFANDPDKLFGGWLPRPSGLTVKFNAKAPAGERVQELKVHGVPVEDDKVYTVTACEREGDIEDSVCRMKGLKDTKVLELDAHQAVRQYLAKHKTIEEPEHDRCVANDLPKVFRSQFIVPKAGDDVLSAAKKTLSIK